MVPALFLLTILDSPLTLVVEDGAGPNKDALNALTGGIEDLRVLAFL